MKLFDVIRSAGEGRFVEALATKAGVTAGEAEKAMRAILPELGQAIRQNGERGAGATAVSHAMHDERYGNYLEHPEALNEPAAAADGERVLSGVLNDQERSALIRRVASASGVSEGQVRTMLPLVASLAMAALGQKAREPSPEIPWFGSRPGDHFDAPLLSALTSLFEHEEDHSSRSS
jgi:hypothetical protein